MAKTTLPPRASAAKLTLAAYNVTRMPTAAPRQVDNYRWADQRKAALAYRKKHPWPGEYVHHQQRQARERAAILDGIEPHPALVILTAMLATMEREQRVAIMNEIAFGQGIYGVHRQAIEFVRATTMNVGQTLDLMRALKRLREAR